MLQQYNTIQRETFEGENFREFQGFVVIGFFVESWGCGVFQWAPMSTNEVFSKIFHWTD